MGIIYRDTCDDTERARMERRVADLEWLVKQDIVFVPEGSTKLNERVKLEFDDYLSVSGQGIDKFIRASEYIRDCGDVLQGTYNYMQKSGDHSYIRQIKELACQKADHLSRLIAADISQSTDTLALPIMATPQGTSAGNPLSRSAVLRIAFDAIPFPCQDTPIESLIDFRNDPDVRADFLALHRWSANVAKINQSPQELKEEVEYLVAQYDKHMMVHGIEASSGFFETVITTSAEMLEDIVKLKWSDAVKLLFSFSKRNVGLLKAELGAPGRELAYFIKARDR